MFTKIIIHQHEKGLYFRNGLYKRLLDPGAHYFLWGSGFRIQRVDMRLQNMTILGQEVLTQDNLPVKLSLVLFYRIVDPVKAVLTVAHHEAHMHLKAQIAIREVIAGCTLEDILQKRGDLNAQIAEKIKAEADEIGLQVDQITFRDIMLPAELRQAYLQVVKAQKEGLAALEKARGESAALRNLANAAHLFKENPDLLQLRFLHTLEHSSGHNLIIDGRGMFLQEK